jgi:hypothetical protein
VFYRKKASILSDQNRINQQSLMWPGPQRSEHEDLIIAHRAWMETPEAKAVYRLRGQTIEIVFADVKEHRGLRRFSGHGLDRVRTEFALEVLLHNLLVVHRSLRQRSNGEAVNRMTEDIAA